jgi:hypothetical protein
MMTKAISNWKNSTSAVIFLLLAGYLSAQSVATHRTVINSDSDVIINEAELLDALDVPALRWSRFAEIIDLPDPPALENQSDFVRYRDLAGFLVSADSRLIQSLSYRLFRGSGAAFRDLQYLGIIAGEQLGRDILSTSGLLDVLSRYDRWTITLPPSNVNRRELSENG